MGNYIYTLNKRNNLSATLKPSHFEWLSVHSLETGLSIVEIERLWVRFKQLGCDNNGYWSEQIVSISKNKIGRDGFQQQIMRQLQAPDQQYITFYDFINASMWLERSPLEEKLKASFSIINDNHPLTIESLNHTLILMFPGKPKEEINQIVEDLFYKIGIVNPQTNISEIPEEDFISFLKSHIAQDRLRELFQFKICPNLKPLNVEPRAPIIQDLSMDPLSDNSNIPTDSQLEAIAQSIGERDYSKLAGLLGILEYDLNHLENVLRGNRPKIVFNILREWKQKNGARASFSALKKALYSSGFKDIFNQMEFG